jgi:hypothetical protein
MAKVMGKRQARRWLMHYAASLLENFECSDPISDRDGEHPGDPEASERETEILQAEIPYVSEKIRKLAGPI